MAIPDLNRVPAEPIIAVIRDYLGNEESTEVFHSSVYLLAERADIRGDTLEKILAGRNQTIDFDIADRLLCVLGKTDLWHGDLKDVYEKSQLDDDGYRRNGRASGMRVCARVTCSEMFLPKPKHPYQRFCSAKCSSADNQLRRNPKRKILGKGRILQKLMCWNGHERTPENTRYTPDGRIYCVECKRKRDRETARRRYVPLGTKGDKSRKLTAETALQVFSAMGTYREIAARFSISPTTVSYVKTGKTWSHVTHA